THDITDVLYSKQGQRLWTSREWLFRIGQIDCADGIVKKKRRHFLPVMINKSDNHKDIILPVAGYK
ncbi:hypothetical protein CHUAL_000047, partial [Chamberlinius hualienensis]